MPKVPHGQLPPDTFLKDLVREKNRSHQGGEVKMSEARFINTLEEFGEQVWNYCTFAERNSATVNQNKMPNNFADWMEQQKKTHQNG